MGVKHFFVRLPEAILVRQVLVKIRAMAIANNGSQLAGSINKEMSRENTKNDEIVLLHHRGTITGGASLRSSRTRP